MKKVWITAVVAAAAFVAGCEHDHHAAPAAGMSSASNGAPMPAASVTPATPAAAAKPAGPKVYPMEVARKGEIYVFSNADSVSKFVATKTPPANMSAKPGFGPAGETVHFETGTAVDDALVAEYQKLHPVKK